MVPWHASRDSTRSGGTPPKPHLNHPLRPGRRRGGDGDGGGDMNEERQRTVDDDVMKHVDMRHDTNVDHITAILFRLTVNVFM